MQTLSVALGDRSYPIHVGRGLLERGDLIAPHLKQKRVAVVSNETVAPLYLARFLRGLQSVGVEAFSIVIPDGEEFKNWDTLNTIYDQLLAARSDRGTSLIALGGGVVGDMTGFAAATYQRGVPYMQVPTTLLAQVDSSVGGKTAINHPRGKNMIGAFYQPRLVLSDMDTLSTLPDRELKAGLAEVIKYGLIRDAEFFAWLEAHVDRLVAKDAEALSQAVVRCCEIKASVVQRDEREEGERALLNFGHTFGHAIETGMGYGAWLHGEAIAAGMALASDLSARLGLISRTDVERINAVLARAGLPTAVCGIPADRFRSLMSVDKKAQAGRLRFILLSAIGSASLRADVPQEALDRTLALAA